MTVTNQPTEYNDAINQPEPPTRITSVRNGLIGGVVAVLLSFLPLSTVLGGGIAGYLDRGQSLRGTTAGVIAGVVAFLPFLLVGIYLGLAGVPLPGPELSLHPAIILTGTTLFALVYTVGLSVLGSLIGGYVRDER